MVDKPADTEQIQLVAVLRVLGCSQDTVASALHVGKAKVGAIEDWITKELLEHVQAIFDDQALKRVVGRELPPLEEVEHHLLVKSGQVTGDDILRHYRDDYVGQHQALAEQSSYVETPHKQKMRELARALAERICLPSLWDKDLWKDIPVEFKPGKYSLPIGTVEIDEDIQTICYFTNCSILKQDYLSVVRNATASLSVLQVTVDKAATLTVTLLKQMINISAIS